MLLKSVTEDFLFKSIADDFVRRIWGDLLRSVSGEARRGDSGDLDPRSSIEGLVRSVPRRSDIEDLILREPVDKEVIDSVRVTRDIGLDDALGSFTDHQKTH